MTHSHHIQSRPSRVPFPTSQSPCGARFRPVRPGRRERPWLPRAAPRCPPSPGGSTRAGPSDRLGGKAAPQWGGGEKTIGPIVFKPPPPKLKSNPLSRKLPPDKTGRFYRFRELLPTCQFRELEGHKSPPQTQDHTRNTGGDRGADAVPTPGLPRTLGPDTGLDIESSPAW